MTIRYVLTFLCGYLLGFNTCSFLPRYYDHFSEEKQRIIDFQTFPSASNKIEEQKVFNHSSVHQEVQVDNPKIIGENKRFVEKVESLKQTLTEALKKSKMEKTLSKISEGTVQIERKNYFETFDFGTPNDGKSEVLLLYNNAQALPSNYKSLPLRFLSSMNATRATENCDYVHVVTIPRDDDRVCTVLIRNYDNFHVQRWMRQDPNTKKLDRNATLRAVNRGMRSNGDKVFRPVRKLKLGSIGKYLFHFDEIISELKPIAAKVSKNNTIVVMTCNMGHSEILMNFVCNARSKGFDLSNVLVFPTDLETKHLVDSLGLISFYHEAAFGHLPKNSANVYGDHNFNQMMFAKDAAVHMVSHLGYDILFQDVDVIWYRNPLEYFHNPQNNLDDFDMYFQDDGGHTTRFAPFAANSGFYYARNNDITRYFFTAMLFGSVVANDGNQSRMNQVLAEFASLYNLRVKVLQREESLFPCGFHYHLAPSHMKKVTSGRIIPFVFHMSWTHNSENKIKFLQQMGQWFITDRCSQQKWNFVKGMPSTAGKSTNSTAAYELNDCCLANPNIVCHYRDKPSIIPCKDFPPIDEGKASFW